MIFAFHIPKVRSYDRHSMSRCFIFEKHMEQSASKFYVLLGDCWHTLHLTCSKLLVCDRNLCHLLLSTFSFMCRMTFCFNVRFCTVLVSYLKLFTSNTFACSEMLQPLETVIFSKAGEISKNSPLLLHLHLIWHPTFVPASKINMKSFSHFFNSSLDILFLLLLLIALLGSTRPVDERWSSFISRRFVATVDKQDFLIAWSVDLKHSESE